MTHPDCANGERRRTLVPAALHSIKRLTPDCAALDAQPGSSAGSWQACGHRAGGRPPPPPLRPTSPAALALPPPAGTERCEEAVAKLGRPFDVVVNIQVGAKAGRQAGLGWRKAPGDGGPSTSRCVQVGGWAQQVRGQERNPRHLGRRRRRCRPWLQGDGLPTEPCSAPPALRPPPVAAGRRAADRAGEHRRRGARAAGRARRGVQVGAGGGVAMMRKVSVLAGQEAAGVPRVLCVVEDGGHVSRHSSVARASPTPRLDNRSTACTPLGLGEVSLRQRVKCITGVWWRAGGRAVG